MTSILFLSNLKNEEDYWELRNLITKLIRENNVLDKVSVENYHPFLDEDLSLILENYRDSKLVLIGEHTKWLKFPEEYQHLQDNATFHLMPVCDTISSKCSLDQELDIRETRKQFFKEFFQRYFSGEVLNTCSAEQVFPMGIASIPKTAKLSTSITTTSKQQTLHNFFTSSH